MRKFLFDVIIGIFIGIGACIAGIIALFDILDNYKEIRGNIVADIKDFIHELLYGYHHNRSTGAYNTHDFSYSTTSNYKSMYDWWNNTTNYSYKNKEDDDEEEAQSGH